MIIKNGNVFQEDGTYILQDLYVENGCFVASPEQLTDKSEYDATGCKIIPGLVDIHSHGAVGHDFSDGDAQGLRKILQYEKSQGITSYCPTSMTLPLEELREIFHTLSKVEWDSTCAEIEGINMEGPFLDPKKKGAHKEEYIVNPSVEFFQECNEAAQGKVKLVTLAPNMEGAQNFIEQLNNEVVISLGHTGADYSCTSKAMEKGALHVTHLYNAMAPIGHREPGLVGAAADHSQCMVELIGDGIHIHPSMVRNTFRLFGEERVVLISDSMMATGMDNGTYQLGGQKVTMKDRKATLTDGTLAGSATNLFDCMRCVIAMGVEEKTAIFAATRNPASSIGIYNRVGSIAPGKEANFVIAKDDLQILRVFVKGI